MISRIDRRTDRRMEVCPISERYLTFIFFGVSTQAAVDSGGFFPEGQLAGELKLTNEHPVVSRWIMRGAVTPAT